MTPDEAFNQQIITQIGSACLTIAQQAAAITDLRNKLAEAEAKLTPTEVKAAGPSEPKKKLDVVKSE